MHDYMLLMSGKAMEWKALSPEENQRLMEKYFAFVTMLKRTHGFVGGSPLKQGGYGLRNEHGKPIVDGPLSETKEILNGYMIFRARDLAEAVELAKQCPALAHGEAVQVFELSGEH